MIGGIYVPSGASVPLIQTLPPADRPVQLADGRILRLGREGIDYRAHPSGVHWQMRFGPNKLKVMISLDPTDAWGPLLHVSVSYQGAKEPTWKDLKLIKAAFFGDVDAAMILPKEEDYIAGVPGNPDSNVFHLWQIPQRWGIR